MKNIIWITAAATLLAAVSALAFVAGGHWSRSLGSPGHDAVQASGPSKRRILYWKGPMDPSFHSKKPGTSPMGMPLVPVYADEAGGPSADVRINPDVVNNLGVRTAMVENGTLSHRIETVGYVGYDQDTLRSINTRADGWIERLAIKSEGESLKQGQLLYRMFSPKLATAQREYLAALASGSASLVRASRQRMLALGFSDAQIRHLRTTGKAVDTVARYAPEAGVVVKLGVQEGAYVMPMTQVMQLADLRTVWIIAEVDAGDAAMLSVGQEAVARFDAFPGQKWPGHIDYIYPDVNVTTRTVKVRLRFANMKNRLQPNMFAHVSLSADPQTGVVSIPNQALIRTGQNQRVIVSLGDGRFDVCPVEAGFTSGDRVQILRGLHAGQKVVTSAQFLIDSEANVSAAALRLGAGKQGCSTSAPALLGRDMEISHAAGNAAVTIARRHTQSAKNRRAGP